MNEMCMSGVAHPTYNSPSNFELAQKALGGRQLQKYFLHSFFDVRSLHQNLEGRPLNLLYE